ncbi:MAG: ATP-binding protein [Verrucomicrobiota bacterium]|nr:ATP-binding protein [Verrucomicrobiota bacterium]
MPDWSPCLYLAFIVILVAAFAALYFLLGKRDRDETDLRAARRDDLARERALRQAAENEVKLKDEWFQQAQKMRALGAMAGGIAHDFNNILTTIIGYAEMALRIVPEQESLHQYMKEVVRAGHRAKDLVTQILFFSRETTPGGMAIRITPIVKEVAKLLGASAPPANVEIQVIIKTDHDVLMADPTLIHQLVMNLCVNALRATKENGGLLELRLTDFIHTAQPKGEFPHLVSGRYLRLSVKDTGHGIATVVIEKIFEPFFTTKERGKGAGMGLAVVQGIVTALKGALTVESQVGKGSVFHVILPAIEKEEETIVEAMRPLPIGNGRVLFVDDDEEILKIVEKMLLTLGYEPIVAQHGAAALGVFSLDPSRFDLVIADMVMPGLGGKELAQELHRLRGDIPVILCTGFSEIPSEPELKALHIRSLIMKPILMHESAEKIRLAMER